MGKSLRNWHYLWILAVASLPMAVAETAGAQEASDKASSVNRYVLFDPPQGPAIDASSRITSSAGFATKNQELRTKNQAKTPPPNYSTTHPLFTRPAIASASVKTAPWNTWVASTIRSNCVASASS